MIREEFLDISSRQNLYGLKLTRDALICLQSGIRATQVPLLLQLQQQKGMSENLLNTALELAKGFVFQKDDSGFFTQYTSLCEDNTAKLGVAFSGNLSVLFANVSKVEQPPIGMRGTLHDCQTKLLKESAVLLEDVLSSVRHIAVAQSEGISQSGFSLTVLEGLKQILSDYGAVINDLLQGDLGYVFTRSDLMRKITRDLKHNIDLSDVKLHEWLSSCEDDVSVLKRLASCAAGGVLKSTYPPLLFDLFYRYALSVH